MANEYHDELGRFCSRTKMKEAIKTAQQTGDIKVYLQLKQDLEKADLKTGYLPTKKKTAFSSVTQTEQDIQERDNLIENGSKQEIQNWLIARTENPEFIELLEERETIKKRSQETDETYKTLVKQYEKGDITNFEIARQKGFEAQELYEELQILTQYVNNYKDITAPAAAKLSEKIVEDEIKAGTYKEYTEDTLHDLILTGDYPSGSREWLEQRQKGIGGSDVGKIIGTEDSTSYNTWNYKDVLTSKLDPISDEEVEKQATGHTEYNGYAGRGNAWEQLIAQKFAENNPNTNITFCKSSWQHKNRPYQFANFDGLMTDENGNPNGILEIKTASDPSKWGPTSAGLDGVPAQYRAQALWYCDAAGFKKGAIAVMINDHEYREYHFNVTPTIQKEIETNRQKVEEFVNTVEKIKNKELPDPREPKDISGRTMFSPTLLRNAIKGDKNALKEASILREETVEQTQARFATLTANINTKDPKEVTKALYTLYSEKPLEQRTKKFINIDLETTHSSPTKGHIIEVGVSVHSPQGGEIEKIQKLYGVPKRALTATGTGAEHVHQITKGMIAKKRTFRHPEEQKRMLQTLKNGILVAHNASFEKSWLRQNLDGFAEAEKNGEIQILDTRSLTYRLLPETKNAKLESFTEKYGIPYKDAHRAYNDAKMMGYALGAFLKEINKK